VSSVAEGQAAASGTGEVRTGRRGKDRGDNSTGSERGFRSDIEGLRALAILPVVAYHASEFVAPGSQALLAPLTALMSRVTGGFLGVDVFFVISGYLITGLLVSEAETRDRIHFGKFYARRARRILPAATVTLLATLVASYFVLSSVRAASVSSDVLWASIFNADVHFAKSGVDYLGVAAAPSPVLQFWSLSDEEKFYLVWPAVLTAATWFAVKVRKWPLRPTLFAALAALGVPSLLWSAYLVAQNSPSAYYTAPSRAFELAAGGMLAIAMPLVERIPRAARVLLAVAGFVTVVTCMFTYTTSTPFPGFAALPVVLGSAAVIAGHPAGVVARSLSVRPVRWVGRISYSLYLWHWPVIVLAAAAIGGRMGPDRALACIAVSFLLAWGSYHLIERPPQRSAWMRPARNALLFGLIAILATVAASIAFGRVELANAAGVDAQAARGIKPVAKKDRSLLFIGDSITSRGEGPLEAALGAAEWNYRIDALDGRPIVSGKRPTWTPLCFHQPGCGADLVLRSLQGAVPGTVVIALGSNSEAAQEIRVAPPTATDSGLRYKHDSRGHIVISGQDSPTAVVREVETVMSLVPRTTTVYWVGLWLDDSIWGNVTWRQTNAAIRTTAARYPNARYLDWAAYVMTAHVPYQPDGSHPDSTGMIMRAHWLATQLE
jgi:peptidoglycan/LPS O-acetylase OafA/YrhL